MQNGTAIFEDSLEVSYKVNMSLLYYPAIEFLGIHPKELKTYVYTKPCTQMFIAALFITTTKVSFSR